TDNDNSLLTDDPPAPHHHLHSFPTRRSSDLILWHDTSKAQDAATNMKITAEDLMRFGVIDEIVPEPVGGAHRDPAAAIEAAGTRSEEHTSELQSLRHLVCRLLLEKKKRKHDV